MESRNPVVIISALPAESHDIQDCLSERVSHTWEGGPLYKGVLEGRPVVVAVCGVGKVCAAMTTQYVIDTYSPEAVILVGLAGGLHAGLNRGDVVLGRELVQHDMDARAGGFARGQIPYTEVRFLKGDPTLLQIASTWTPCRPAHAREGSRLPRVMPGRILTGDQFIARSEGHFFDYLTAEFEGDAVEMEGASVAFVAATHGVPCLVIRTISDAGDEGAFADFKDFLGDAARGSLGLVGHILKNQERVSREKGPDHLL